MLFRQHAATWGFEKEASMKRRMAAGLAVAALAWGGAAAEPTSAQLGASVDSLLDYARTRNPDYAAMQSEAEAAGERIGPAGALPDPKLRMELMDVTRSGVVPWCSPNPRAIFPLDREPHWSRSLRRTMRKHPFRVSKDEAFGEVMRLC